LLPSGTVLVCIMMEKFNQKSKSSQLSLKYHPQSTYFLFKRDTGNLLLQADFILSPFVNGRDYFVPLTISVGNSEDDKKDKKLLTSGWIETCFHTEL